MGSNRRRLLDAFIIFLLSLFGTAVVVRADGSTILELFEWNQQLAEENWQVFLAPNTQDSLGVFLPSASLFDWTDYQYDLGLPALATLSDCGVGLVALKRTQFTSPNVPPILAISDVRSIRMSEDLSSFFARNPAVKSVLVSIFEPRWDRILTSETTAKLYSSAPWSNPAFRAAIISCIQQHGKLIVDSNLVARVELQFFGTDGFAIRVASLNIDPSKGSLFVGTVSAGDFTLVNQFVTIARRIGVCVDSSVFFDNAIGAIGSEIC